MIMQIFKKTALSLLCVLMFVATVHAAEETNNNALSGVKLGFGFDQGFSVVGAAGNFYGALGDKGIALDYIFMKQKLNAENIKGLHWFIGGGGFAEWDGDWGARLPIGAELPFAKNLDAYAEAIPRLRFNNNKDSNTDFGLDFAIGVRYQF